jgi:mitochondrial fission protein ELM1
VTKICRIITDDKIGNINPALALAEAITHEIPLEIQHIHVKNNLFLRILPAFVIRFLSSYFLIEKIFKIPYNPNVVITIGNGSASIVPCLVLSCLKKRHKDTGLFVQLQNPRINSDYFDYVVAPDHDNLWGHNIIPIIGSLSRIKNLLRTTSFKMPPEFAALKKPIIGVFIGGRNSRYAFSSCETQELADYLHAYSINNTVSLAITCSRRTDKKNEMILRSVLKGDNIYFPDSTCENPYYLMLQHCDASIVTSDSVNMVSDSITAGLPTYLYELRGEKGKFSDFYTILKQKRVLFSASNDYHKTTIDAFNETDRVARIMIAALLKKKDYHG